MEKAELIKKATEVIAEEFEVETNILSADADIKTTLELDSLSLVDLVALIEETFGIKLNGSDITGIKTFGALYDFIYEKIK